tara:strand:- start:6867 stop:15596 length:8730 start_codon:yes stop_codon:yes gene_type:complete
MDEEALQDAYTLFTGNGYSKSIDEFKNLVSTNPKALKDAHTLFAKKGYKGDEKAFATLIGANGEEKGSSNILGPGVQMDASKKKVSGDSTDSLLASETTPSSLDGKKDENTSELIEAEDPVKLRDLPEQLVDLPIADLYDQYKAAGKITSRQEKNIEAEVERQIKGDRKWYETFSAFTQGMLTTGMAIPLYKFDTEEQLLEQQGEKNRTNFLSALPEEKVQELNAFAVRGATTLPMESVNIMAENTILEEQSKKLVNNIKKAEEIFEDYKGKNEPIPPAGIEDYKKMFAELQDIATIYNQNVDLLENNNEAIGSFTEELESLKKNYGGLDYYVEVLRLAGAGMVGGVMEFGTQSAKMGALGPQNISYGYGWEKSNKEYREEVERQRSFIKPQMSVGDIESPRGFGKWLLEQTAAQLPVIVTLAAGGGAIGLTALGASAGGGKMGELKDEGGYNDVEIYLAGLGVGAFEVLSERVSLGILSKGKRTLKTTLSSTSRSQLKMGVKDFVTETTKDAISEGGFEYVNQVAQNALDILYLGKSDVHFFDETLDALASGTAMGWGMSATPSLIGMGAKAFMPPATSDKILVDSKKVGEILETLETKKETLDEGTKKLLKKEVKRLLKGINKEMRRAYEDLTNLEKPQIKALIDIDKKANSLIAQAKKIHKSDMSADLKKDLLEGLQKDADKLSEKKTELLEQAKKAKKVVPEVVTKEKKTVEDLEALPDRGLKLKDQAAKLLQKEFEDAGQKEFEITDEQITKKALELFEAETPTKVTPTEVTPKETPKIEGEEIQTPKGDLADNVYTTNDGESFKIDIFDAENGQVDSFADRKRTDRLALAIRDENGDMLADATFWQNEDGTWFSNLVNVSKPLRRKGIATALYKFAQAQGLKIVPSEKQTKSGKKLSESLYKKGEVEPVKKPPGKKAPLKTEDVENEISVTQADGGFKFVSGNREGANDLRLQANNVENRDQKLEEFKKEGIVVFEITKREKTFIVAQVGYSAFGGRTGSSMASIEKTGKLPDNIQDILTLKAGQQWLNSPRFMMNDAASSSEKRLGEEVKPKIESAVESLLGKKPAGKKVPLKTKEGKSPNEQKVYSKEDATTSIVLKNKRKDWKGVNDGEVYAVKLEDGTWIATSGANTSTSGMSSPLMALERDIFPTEAEAILNEVERLKGWAEKLSNEGTEGASKKRLIKWIDEVIEKYKGKKPTVTKELTEEKTLSEFTAGDYILNKATNKVYEVLGKSTLKAKLRPLNTSYQELHELTSGGFILNPVKKTEKEITTQIFKRPEVDKGKLLSQNKVTIEGGEASQDVYENVTVQKMKSDDGSTIERTLDKEGKVIGTPKVRLSMSTKEANTFFKGRDSFKLTEKEITDFFNSKFPPTALKKKGYVEKTPAEKAKIIKKTYKGQYANSKIVPGHFTMLLSAAFGLKAFGPIKGDARSTAVHKAMKEANTYGQALELLGVDPDAKPSKEADVKLVEGRNQMVPSVAADGRSLGFNIAKEDADKDIKTHEGLRDLTKEYPELVGITDKTLSKATAEQLYLLSQMAHPTDFGFTVHRSKVMDEWRKRGEQVFKELGFPTDPNYPYKNVHTQKTISPLKTPLDGNNWWSVAEHQLPISNIAQEIKSQKKFIKDLENELAQLPKKDKKRGSIEYKIGSAFQSLGVLADYQGEVASKEGPKPSPTAATKPDTKPSKAVTKGLEDIKKSSGQLSGRIEQKGKEVWVVHQDGIKRKIFTGTTVKEANDAIDNHFRDAVSDSLTSLPLDSVGPKKGKLQKGEKIPVESKTDVKDIAYEDVTHDRVEELVSERIEHAKRKPIKKTKKLSQIVADVSKALGATLIYGGTKGGRTVGTYYPASALVRIKNAGKLDTVAHELGHMLDDKFDLLKNVDKSTAVTEQLHWFSERGGSNPPSAASPAQKLDYLKREGLAEFIRAYVANPVEAQKKAPELFHLFESTIDEHTKKALEYFSNDFLDFANSPAGEKIMANTEGMALKERKRLLSRAKEAVQEKVQEFKNEEGVFKITPWDRFKTSWTGSMTIANKAFEFANSIKGVKLSHLNPMDNFKMMSRLFAGINGKINNALNKGLVNAKNEVIKDSQGKEMNIKYLIDVLDNTSDKALREEMDDVIKLLVAERTLEYSVKKEGRELRAKKKEIEKALKILEKKMELGAITEQEISNMELMEDVLGKIGERLFVLENFKPGQDIGFKYKDNLTGVSGGIGSDVKIVSEHLRDVDKMKREDPKKYERIKEGARRYREFADAGLRYAVDSGRLSEESYQQIKQNNQYYVSLARTKEIVPGEETLPFLKQGNKLTSVKEVIRISKGGSDMIKNPYMSLLKNTVDIMKEGDRNTVLTTFMAPLSNRRGMGQGKPLDLSQIARKATAKDKRTIKIFNHGAEEHWQFDKDIYEALKGIGEISSDGAIVSMMKPLATLIRNTVTTFPVFATRNFWRDTFSRMVLSRSNGSLRDLNYSAKDQKAFETFGGSQAGFHLTNADAYEVAMGDAIKTMTRKGHIVLDPRKLRGRDIGKFWDRWKRVLEKGENANRIAEYKSAYRQAIKDGMDEYNAGLFAAYQARDLMDFAVAGTYMREINKVIPFSNAAVQSVKRSIKGAKENPAQFAIRMAIHTLIPQLISRAIVMAMGDDEEYEQLPDYQRDLFWNFKTPMTGDAWISLPKPFELGLASSMVDRGISLAAGNKDAFEGSAMSTVQTLFPFDESTLGGAFKPILEAAFNYDAFRDRNVVPYWEEGKDMELREGTQYASRVGQGLTSAFGFVGAEVDPRKIDHVIKGYTTYWGTYGLALLDIGKADSRNQFNFTKTGFAKGIPVSNAKSVQKALRLAKDIGYDGRKEIKTLKGMIKLFYHLESTEATTKEEKNKKRATRKKLTEDIYAYSKILAETYEEVKKTKKDYTKMMKEGQK